MEHIWAPWRLSYVAAPKGPGTDEGCFICNGLEQRTDRENLVVLRTELSVVILNRYPYNNGHLLVAPRAHKGNLGELRNDELMETMQTLKRMVGLLNEILRPEGYNIGLNLGQAGGAGLPGHLHWHVVPRWNGDTNFMPVLSDTKVIVQSLSSLFDLLTSSLNRSQQHEAR